MKNESGLAAVWIILIAVIALALGAGGVWYWQQSQQPAETTPSATTQPTTPTPNPTTSTPTGTDTATWKLFDNTKYAYSVKYPSDWRVEAYGDGSSIIAFGDPTDSSKVVQIEVDASNPDKLAIFDWIKAQDWPDPAPVEQQFTSINDIDGVDAYKQTGTGTVYFTKDDKVFYIENGVGFERKVVSDSIFNGFLTTFQFSS